MKNSYYCVDGVTARLIKFQIWEDNQTVRIFMSTRYYDFAFEDIPEALRHWIPVDMDGARAYDHTLAELGIAPLAVQSNIDINTEEDEDQQIIQIKALLIKTIIDQTKESSELKDRLNQVIISLKDPKHGTYAANIIPQTKQIISAVVTFQKINANNLEAFNQAIKLFTESKKSNRK